MDCRHGLARLFLTYTRYITRGTCSDPLFSPMNSKQNLHTSTYRLSPACCSPAMPSLTPQIHPSIQLIRTQRTQGDPTTIALKLTLPSAQSVEIVDPLAIATVPSALFKVATTGPVPPLNGTAKWVAPEPVTWKIVAGLFPI